MNTCTSVYLAGAMAGNTYEKAMEWRCELEEAVYNQAENGAFFFFCPPEHFNYTYQYHKTEREVKEFEIQALCKCDVVVVDFDKVNGSVGTHFELATADALNRFTGKNIFVIGFGDTTDVHPWILDSCHRIEDDVQGVADYLIQHFYD